MSHSETVAPDRAASQKGDDSPRAALYARCPDAFDRLDRFNLFKAGYAVADDFVGVELDAEIVARVVQDELHQMESPLTCAQADAFHNARLLAFNALIYVGGFGDVGGNKLAKEVEARVSPDGQPLAICVGSNKRQDVPVCTGGEIEMPGYIGCLATFPDTPFRRGRMWARLCSECRARQANAREKEIRRIKRRAAQAAAMAAVR